MLATDIFKFNINWFYRVVLWPNPTDTTNDLSIYPFYTEYAAPGSSCPVMCGFLFPCTFGFMTIIPTDGMWQCETPKNDIRRLQIGQSRHGGFRIVGISREGIS